MTGTLYAIVLSGNWKSSWIPFFSHNKNRVDSPSQKFSKSLPSFRPHYHCLIQVTIFSLTQVLFFLFHSPNCSRSCHTPTEHSYSLPLPSRQSHLVYWASTALAYFSSLSSQYALCIPMPTLHQPDALVGQFLRISHSIFLQVPSCVFLEHMYLIAHEFVL